VVSLCSYMPVDSDPLFLCEAASGGMARNGPVLRRKQDLISSSFMHYELDTTAPLGSGSGGV
jgi:hypothetical protein